MKILTRTGVGKHTERGFGIISDYQIDTPIAELEGIAVPDVAVIIMAERHKDVLLVNDKALIQVARSRGVQCYWLTTFLLHCVRRDVLSAKEGKQFLHDLIQEGMMLSTKVYARLLQKIGGPDKKR